MTTTNLPRYKSAGNAHLFPKTYRKIKGPSLTVPDQVLSMRQIMERHTRGLPITGGMNPEYPDDQENLDFDDYMPPIETMDISEIHDIAAASKARTDDIKKKYKKFKDEKTKDAWLQEYKRKEQESNQNSKSGDQEIA